MTHEEYKDLLAANALTALDAEDARALEAHLEGCADCRSQMNEWQDTAAFLGLDATPLEPSSQLRERIVASVRSETDQSSVVATDDLIDRAEPAIDSRDAKVLPFERQRGNVWTALGSLGAIAAAFVLVGLLVSLILLWQQNRATQRELAQLSMQMQEARAQLAREREMVELLTSPGARMAELTGTNAAPSAHALLAYDKNGHAMLMAKGLPAAPNGMAYQLWFIMGKKPMPGKVFTADAAGNASLADQVPMPMLTTPVFAITLEPEKGMPSPTGAIYLSSGS